MRTTVWLFIALFSAHLAVAQGKQITMDDLWKNNTFRVKDVPGFNAMKDGTHYTRIDKEGKRQYIKIYDLEDYTLINTLKGHTMAIFSLQYAPDSSYLVSGSRDAQVKIWNTTTFELIENIPAHLFAVNHIAFHPTQPYFATASMDKSMKIWGSDDYKLYKVISREKGYDTHRLSINKLVWNDGQLLSASDDKRIIIWDISF